MVAPRKPTSPNGDNNSWLLGVGFDGDDEHQRLTKGDNFCLVGGSEETHDRMTETAIKLNERLAARGKNLAEASPDEITGILEDLS